MGREATVTVEQVHATANALHAEGIKPTLRLVRERLGTGSMGTINSFLQRWRSGQQLEQSQPLVMPPVLQRAILDFMGSEIAAAKGALEGQITEQRQELSDLAAENMRQAEVIEHLQVDMELLATEKSAIAGRAEQLLADLATAKEEASRERHGAELARTELAKSQLRLEAMPRLVEDLEQIRADLAKERQQRIDAEQRAAVLTAQKADLDDRMLDFKARLGETKQDAARGAEEVKAAQQRIDTLVEQLASVRYQLRATEANAAELFAKLEAVSTVSGEPGKASLPHMDAPGNPGVAQSTISKGKKPNPLGDKS